MSRTSLWHEKKKHAIDSMAHGANCGAELVVPLTFQSACTYLHYLSVAACCFVGTNTTQNNLK